MMHIDYQDPDSIDRAITAIQGQYVALVGKTERGEALTTAEILSVAHWVGIAQGVLSERSAALRAGRPLNHRAQVMDFYVKQEQARAASERPSDGDECVLMATGVVGLGTLGIWAADDDKPLRQVIAQAELYRRGKGPDPRKTEQGRGLLLSEKQANAAEAGGLRHLADALRQRTSEGESRSVAPSGPSTHPERQSCLECSGIHAADEPHRAPESPFWRRP